MPKYLKLIFLSLIFIAIGCMPKAPYAQSKKVLEK